MVNWIAAVKRCSVSKPGRHTNGDHLALARFKQEQGEELPDEDVTAVLPPPSPSDSKARVLLREFVSANDHCAECDMQPVTSVF